MIAKVRQAGVRWRALCAAVAVHVDDVAEAAAAGWPYSSLPTAAETPDVVRHVLRNHRWSYLLAIAVAATLIALAAHALT